MTSPDSNKCRDLIIPPKASSKIMQNGLYNLKMAKEERQKLVSKFCHDMKQTADRMKLTHNLVVPVKELKFVRPNRVETITIDKKTHAKSEIENRMDQTITIETTGVASKIPRPKPYQNQRQNKTIVDTNELKIKVLARKFAFLWLRKVYGRVLPSTSIKFYNQRLLNYTLNEWKNTWWQQRQEWRLNVKAKCFENYILYRKVWTQWIQFVKQNRSETHRNNIAINFHSIKLKKKYFFVWTDFKHQAKSQRKRLNNIQEGNKEQILQFYFEKWQNKYSIYRKRYKTYELATRHYNLVTLSKIFILWKVKYNQLNKNKQNLELANGHYQEVLLGKCFNSLIYYTKYRHRKDKQKVKVDEYYESQLIYRVFKTWSFKYELLWKEKKSQGLVESFQRRRLLFTYYKEWYDAYKFEQKLFAKEKLCVRLYEKKLKQNAINVLKSLVKTKHLELSNDLRASEFYAKWILKRFSIKWFERLEQKEDIKVLHLIFKATKHHELFILELFFTKWYKRLKNCIQFNNEYEKYDQIYEDKLKKKVFENMRIFVTQNKYKRDNYLKADKRYSDNKLYQTFSWWYERSNNSINDRMNERIAILHYEEQFKQKLFAIWFKRYERVVDDKYRDEEMYIYYEGKLKEKLFNKWLRNVHETKHEQKNEQLALKYDLTRVCKAIFVKWKSKIEKSKADDKKYERAIEFYRNKKCQGIFLAWKLLSKRFSAKKQEAMSKYNQKIIELKRVYFSELRAHARESTQDKRMEKIANAFHVKTMLVKILKKWKKHVDCRHEKKANELNQIAVYQKTQSKIYLRSYLMLWKQKKKDKMRNEFIIEQSRINLKQKMWINWKKYTRKRREHKALEKKADWFNEMRLKLQCYNQWSIEYHKIKDEHDLHIKAVCFWAWKLQQKIFVNWLTYINERKIKKKRYDNAIADRQNDIIRLCIQQLLVYSSDAKQRRQKSAIWYGKSRYINTKELALKYVNIWREKVAEKYKLNVSKSSITSERIITHLATFIDNQPSVNRPKPRKPSFLLDSIQVQDRLENAQQDIEVEPPKLVIQEIKQNQPLLLPPSAFTTLKPSSSNASISSVLIPPILLNAHSTVNIDSKQNTSSSTNSNELIQLKQRIEKLTIKKDNLKRLKEQEALLHNCISSSEVTNMSISETIYDEINQIRIEINDLTLFIKQEKQKITFLLKKYQG